MNPSRLGTYDTWPLLSREEFDAIEFDAVRSGDHASAAELMNQLAATERRPLACRSRGVLRAASSNLMADDPVAAVGGFRRAWRRRAVFVRPGSAGPGAVPAGPGRRAQDLIHPAQGRAAHRPARLRSRRELLVAARPARRPGLGTTGVECAEPAQAQQAGHRYRPRRDQRFRQQRSRQQCARQQCARRQSNCACC